MSEMDGMTFEFVPATANHEVDEMTYIPDDLPLEVRVMGAAADCVRQF